MEAIPYEIDLPDTLPVMVLGECTLFPHCLLPLYIFEPRYREMLEHALENDRMFCIGTVRSDHDSEDDEAIHDISTAGLIRACVAQPDGTSHLILQGLKRVRLASWEKRTPFRVARIETYLDVETHAAGATDGLAGEDSTTASPPGEDLTAPGSRDSQSIAWELLDLAASSDSLSDALVSHLRELRDPSAVADVVAYNVIRDSRLKQEILEIPRLSTRLRLLLAYCSAHIADGGSQH